MLLSFVIEDDTHNEAFVQCVSKFAKCEPTAPACWLSSHLCNHQPWLGFFLHSNDMALHRVTCENFPDIDGNLLIEIAKKHFINYRTHKPEVHGHFIDISSSDFMEYFKLWPA